MVVPISGRLWLRRTMTLALVVVGTSVGPLFGQQRPTERPAFEAARIKVATTPGNPAPVVPVAPNRLRIPSQTLIQLIYTAYGNGGFNTGRRVTGGPDWARNSPFFVEGVAAGPATAQQMRLMLQTLLEERFALKISNETTTGDMLTLVLDRSDGGLGPKVRKWNGTCPGVIPPLVFPAPRRPLERVDDKLVVPPRRTRTIPRWPTVPPAIASAESSRTASR